MPVRIERQPHLDLTIFVVEQKAPLSERLAALESFYEQGPSGNVLWDLTAMTGPRPAADEVYAVVDLLNRYRHHRQYGRTAVVGHTDLDFGLSRMGVMFAETKQLPWQLGAFRTREDALAWLMSDSDRQEIGAGG